MKKSALSAAVLFTLFVCDAGSAPVSTQPSAPSTACTPAPAKPSTVTGACGIGEQIELLPTTAAAIKERAASKRADATVVNVWATWCEPCREELPALAKLHQTHFSRGVRVELVSADAEPAKAKDFLMTLKLASAPAQYSISEPLDRFVKAMNPSWSAGLPATFVFAKDGTLSRFWVGRADYGKFAREAERALAKASL